MTVRQLTFPAPQDDFRSEVPAAQMTPDGGSGVFPYGSRSHDGLTDSTGSSHLPPPRRIPRKRKADDVENQPAASETSAKDAPTIVKQKGGYSEMYLPDTKTTLNTRGGAKFRLAEWAYKYPEIFSIE